MYILAIICGAHGRRRRHQDDLADAPVAVVAPAAYVAVVDGLVAVVVLAAYAAVVAAEPVVAAVPAAYAAAVVGELVAAAALAAYVVAVAADGLALNVVAEAALLHLACRRYFPDDYHDLQPDLLYGPAG
jgi:hypothetical protein